MDCISITVESDLYERIGRVFDKHGKLLYKGYKVVCLANLLPNHKLVVVGLIVFPITVADINCAKILISHILRTQGVGFIKELIMDMGFLDGAWIHELKTRYRIDVFIPVRENMDILADALGLARLEPPSWIRIQDKEGREIALFNELTTWDSTDMPLNCCLIRDRKPDGSYEYWAIVTTKKVNTALEIYAPYSDRWDLEEAFNELTCLWNYDRFYSTKWSLVMAQIFFTMAVYSMVSLYKTKVGGQVAEMGIKRLRLEHFRSQEDAVVYLEDCYGIFTVQELLVLVLENLDAFAQNKEQLLAILKKPPG